MITYLLGLPGSGKSYYAVDRIFNNFSDNEKAKKDKKVTFQNCYTNINEFQFDKVNNVYSLDFEELFKILTHLHGLHKKKKSDKFLSKFCQRVKIKDTLFVIDEAHNYFDVKNPILVWWLSYHRHLYHEIILITQSLSLIEAKYKAFSEFFFVAKPQSLSLFKSHFKYNQFTQSRLSKASAVGSIKVRRQQEVFSLYHSGDSINSKNMVLKYILITLSIFSALFTFMYFWIASKTPDIVDETEQLKKSVTLQHKQTVTDSGQKIIIEDEEQLNDTDFTQNKYFKLECSKKKCINEELSIPPQLLRLFIQNKSVLVLYSERVNQNLSVYYLDTTNQFYRYLIPKKEVQKNEKSSLSTTNILGFGSSSK